EQVPAVWYAPTTTPADRRQVVRLLIDRVVLTVDPTDDRIAVRVEWAGGAVREQTVRRPVRGYRHQRDWPQLSARLAALHEQDQAPAEIAVALNGAGFRAPKRSADFTAGMVRRLRADLGLRPRVSRSATAIGVLADGEWWLHELARELGASPHTLHGWRNKKWVHARQVSGRGGPWAVWAGGSELDRLRELKACPRVWANRERLARVRVPSPRV
ncbi:MAG: recombinase family protein, partial [Gemmata sp.]